MGRSLKDREELQKKLIGTLTNKKDIWKNHPFFVKKAQEAKEFIERVGLPEELTKKKRRKVK